MHQHKKLNNCTIKNSTIFIMGLYSAKVNDKANSSTVDKFGLGQRIKENQLVDFAEKYVMVIWYYAINIFYKDRRRFLYTANQTQNQIYYVNIRYRKNVYKINCHIFER